MLKRVFTHVLLASFTLGASCTALAFGPEFSSEMVVPKQGAAVPKSFSLNKVDREHLKNHDKAVQIFSGMFLRDPYIMKGPDGYFYYTGTRLDRVLGGAKYDYKNEGVEIWRSKNLADWELLGVPVKLGMLSNIDAFAKHAATRKHNQGKALLWAPELHYLNNKWYITHTTNSQRAVLWVADNVMGPYQELMGTEKFGHRHDPTLFQDDDGKNYMLYAATDILQLNSELSAFQGQKKKAWPSDRKIGHEGTFVIKHEDKYVLFGTAWSTDKPRKGTYNLYYATADNILGPYSERKWVGRFLGHGTPFKDSQGRWWMTAFKNGTYVPYDDLMLQNDQGDDAYTGTQSGAMLVPMEIDTDETGEVRFTVKDYRFATPGPEEVQQF
ncbi:family 43 glycosylhydrolase [Echinimonas agarilytica]|uniref:Family 43 glycosylhydrolase n=1 Tax=Echinimonas agarilytica TaxID=1215918 RepID=A0AA41W453_9GAMM|nr:family 43 glycosylhydrolase [Echinimonas agarilytica]MCM2678510.1 family 43 glycosylhydrolase [Echinimonas agarilytica]